MQEEEDKLKVLKDLLFSEEKESSNALSQKIEELEHLIHKKERLSRKVDPIVDDKLNIFIQKIPETLGPTITEALKKEIRTSQDAVVEALYPIMGSLIKRFIQHEIKVLAEKINQQTKKAFSFRNWWSRTKRRRRGVDEGTYQVTQSIPTQIEQIFVIEKDSGILLSSVNLAEGKHMDEQMIAGMLTAIKMFVEDAFKKDNQSLESIEYERYTLHIQTFVSYYIVVAITGPYTDIFKDKLEDKLLDFAVHKLVYEDLQNFTLLTKKLKQYFA